MSTTPQTPLNLDNIQGDIIQGLLKKVERYVFLTIKDVELFRAGLQQLAPAITTATQVKQEREMIKQHKADRKTHLLPITGINIAFSRFGLNKLGLTEDINDAAFTKGQLNDARPTSDLTKPGLGDPFDELSRDPKWIPEFKKQIDLVILISGNCEEGLEERAAEIRQFFGVGTPQQSIEQIYQLQGNVRPEPENGHEHFGFMDGISQPAIENFDIPFPGQKTVPAGVILMGNDLGDISPGKVPTHPDWTKDGSFLVFRKLAQLVPEFNDFLAKNPIVLPGLTPEAGSEFLGARMMGRWKSGAPIDITPLKDDPQLADDAERNNNFNYSDTLNVQDRCPFTAHIRKTNPRDDLGDVAMKPRRIIRQGIPYGPEVTAEEKLSNKTAYDRGLAFVCYQSSIDNGFHFIQESWANNIQFPFGKLVTKPGFDPIIGMKGNDTRDFTGFDPQAQDKSLTETIDFVVPQGGEYFFSPSIKTLKEVLAKSA
nr:dye decolorizing peroxidase [uncultured fungus]